VPLDAILSRERRRHDLDREVALAARIVAGVAAMLGRIVDHGEMVWG